MRAFLLGIIVVSGGLGCRSMQGMVEESNTQEGTIKEYKIGKAKALEVAKVVLKEQGADSFKIADDWVIGSFGTNLITWGIYCGVYPKETAPDSCELRVISRRKASLSIFTSLTEGGFHDAFEAKLRRVSR